MTQLQLINENGKFYADSRQVAEMIGKLHKNLLKSIDSYVEVLGQGSKLSSDNFFIKSCYQAGTGKTYPCYKLTRKGCDMVIYVQVLNNIIYHVSCIWKGDILK